MNEELNLEPYRQAWQAEKERLQSAPPRHTEQDIAAMLSRHDAKKAIAPVPPQRRRTLPIWFGSAAASVAILLGVAWFLWLRPTSGPNTLPSLAELRPQTSSQIPSTIPTTPMIPITPNHLNSPITQINLTTPPSSNISVVTDTPIITTEDTQSSIINPPTSIPADQPVAQPSINSSATQPQLQAFQETSITHNIKKQKTPKDPLVRTVNTRPVWTSLRSQSTQIALSCGVSFAQGRNPQPLFGISVTHHDAESNGIIGANKQGAIYLRTSLPSDTASMAVSIQYGYGLNYRPSERLILRVNCGAFVQFVDFDLGLRFNAVAGYQLNDDFTLTAGYQYCMPGIVSGESCHAAILSIGYIIN